MMWNWLVSALASGATLVLYDGAPLHPDPGVLWRLAERERINVFGTSAQYLSALEKSGYEPRAALRAAPRCASMLSTGSPLAPSSFDFVYRSIKAGRAALVDRGRHGSDLVLRARQSAAARATAASSSAAASA